MAQTKDLFTWTGINVDDITNELSVEFDSGGYKPIPSGANLTDINTGYMIERCLNVFGPKGLGWGLEYDSPDLEYQGEGKRVLAVLKKATFWYKLFNAAGMEVIKCEIPCSGAHQNEYAYAAEGARTSALGGALKGLGFQLPLYKGMWDSPAARENARTERASKPREGTAGVSPEVAEYMKDLIQFVGAELNLSHDDARSYVKDVLKQNKMKPDEAFAAREKVDEIVKELIAKDKAG